MRLHLAVDCHGIYNVPAHKEIVAGLTAHTIEHNRQVGSPPIEWWTGPQLYNRSG